MQLNLPPKVRFAIYVATGIGDILVAYLLTVNVLGTAEAALWVSLSAFVKGLAALNTDTEEL